MKAFAIALTLLTLILPPVYSATYFVDSRSGKDTNSGSSPAVAWSTLTRVNTTKFLPGDTILFKRGCSWTGTLSPSGSGAKSKVITIDAYSRGSSPIINGNGADNALVLNGQSYWTLKNLEITNTSAVEAARSGVLIQAVDTVSQGITLQNLYVHDVSGIAAWGTPKWGNAGIRFNIWQDPSPLRPTSMSDVLVDGCKLQDIHAIAILMLSNSVEPNTNVVISNNFINRTGADGIVVQNCKGPIIRDNTCYRAGHLSNDFQYIAAIWAMESDSPLFQHNEVAYTAVQVTNGAIFYGDSQAFDIDDNCTGTPIIEDNYSHENGGGFLLVMDKSTFNAVYARYNVSVNDGRTNCGNNSTFHLGRGQVYFYNNVFYDGNRLGIVAPDVAGTFYENNIFDSTGPCVYGAQAKYTHNCYTGHSPAVADDGKVLDDPLFVNPGSAGDGFGACSGYKIKKKSPCRSHAGSPPASTDKDFFGKPIGGGLLDIGADQM